MWIAIALIGLGVGFLGGLFGKGGSAVATPLLFAVGIPAIAAVASPLPATIPSTIVAARAYHKMGYIQWRTIALSLVIGIPSTIVGALATRWIGGAALVTVTEVIIIGIGVRLVLSPSDPESEDEAPEPEVWRLVAVGGTVGFLAGLLANSGGFLLAPLYLAVARLPIKAALGASLAVAAVLAVPGTIVHAALGHIDWTVTAVIAATSIPASKAGATVALRTASDRLERIYGLALVALGGGLLLLG